MASVFVLENLPVFDIISDVYLLATEWPKTATNAPSDLDECSIWRSLWYVALAFTIVGTLVDLVPEALMLTELFLHPRILRDRSALWEVLKLLCSDGKPIISFAASQDDVGETLEVVRTSLQKRCDLYNFFRFEIHDKDGPFAAGEKMFSGIQGSLAAGEVLTAVGAGLFLSIEFSWPAFTSIVWSTFAFLASTRRNMMAVQHFEGFPPSFFDEVERRSHLAMVVPGPATFLKYILAVPLWPISLSLWGVFQSSPSDEHVWVWAPSWFGVSGFSASRALDWFLFPHYICNWVVAPLVVPGLGLWGVCVLLLSAVLPLVFVLELLQIGKLWRWYFGRPEGENYCMEWTCSLAGGAGTFFFKNSQESIVALLELFGSALSTLMANHASLECVWVFFAVQAAALGMAIFLRDCAEQEWALASAHLGWSFVFFCAKSCSNRNPFRNSPRVGCENDGGTPEIRSKRDEGTLETGFEHDEGTPETGFEHDEGTPETGFEHDEGIPDGFEHDEGTLETGEVDRSTAGDSIYRRSEREVECAQ